MALAYDRVAPTYDARYRAGGPKGVAASLHDLVAGAARALEVGCGTGHWLTELAPQVIIVGLDRSRGMLDRARAAGAPALVHGDATVLPFRDASFDALYCVNAIHHFADGPAFIGEAARVLRPGGRIAVIGMDPAAGRDRWYLYDFFPGTLDADRRRFPPAATTAAWMSAAGFGAVECGVAALIHAMPHGREVFADPVLGRHGTSQFSLLSDDEFEAGMARIEAAVEATPEREFPVDIALAMVTARRG